MQQNQDQEFQKSLEHLEDILPENLAEDEAKPKLAHSSKDEGELIEDLIGIDLAELEEAVADIEEYLDKKHKK